MSALIMTDHAVDREGHALNMGAVPHMREPITLTTGNCPTFTDKLHSCDRH
jgi:hypothetical protein